MRTTIDIDTPILEDLKRLQKKQGKTLGRLVSDLLAQALKAAPAKRSKSTPLRWIARPMRAKVDLTDRDAIFDALDQARPPQRPTGQA